MLTRDKSDGGSYTHRVDLNRRRLARVFSVAVAVIGTVVGLGLVIVASGRRAPHSQSGEGVPGLLKNLGGAALVVYTAVALYVVAMVRFRGQQRRSARSTGNPVAAIAAFLFFVLFVVFLLSKYRRLVDRVLPNLRRTTPQATPERGLPKIAVDKPITWGYQLGFALVLLIVVVAVTMTLRARRSRVVPSAQADLRTRVAVSLEDLLTELEREVDPRRAVLLADHGMEMALAQHGLPRAATETAQEHVQRVATELSLSNSAAQTLNTLYGQAHFGANEITPDDRHSAIVALRSVRNELREHPSVKVDLR